MNQRQISWEIPCEERKITSKCLSINPDSIIRTNMLKEENLLFDEYICSICKNILCCPINYVCSHLFCKKCLEKWGKGKEKNKCPICQKEFNQPFSTWTINQFVQHKINQLKVSCKYANNKTTLGNFSSSSSSSSSCSVVLALKNHGEDIFAHHLICPYQTIKCTYCKHDIEKHEYKKHLTTICPEYIHVCPYCKMNFKTIHYYEHRTHPSCCVELLPCPNLCASARYANEKENNIYYFKKSFLKVHLLECRKRKIECPVCFEKIEYQHISEHYEKYKTDFTHLHYAKDLYIKQLQKQSIVDYQGIGRILTDKQDIFVRNKSTFKWSPFKIQSISNEYSVDQILLNSNHEPSKLLPQEKKWNSFQLQGQICCYKEGIKSFIMGSSSTEDKNVNQFSSQTLSNQNTNNNNNNNNNKIFSIGDEVKIKYPFSNKNENRIFVMDSFSPVFKKTTLQEIEKINSQKSKIQEICGNQIRLENKWFPIDIIEDNRIESTTTTITTPRSEAGYSSSYNEMSQSHTIPISSPSVQSSTKNSDEPTIWTLLNTNTNRRIHFENKKRNQIKKKLKI